MYLCLCVCDLPCYTCCDTCSKHAKHLHLCAPVCNREKVSIFPSSPDLVCLRVCVWWWQTNVWKRNIDHKFCAGQKEKNFFSPSYLKYSTTNFYKIQIHIQNTFHPSLIYPIFKVFMKTSRKYSAKACKKWSREPKWRKINAKSTNFLLHYLQNI